jgi:hypothetical protein
MQVWPCKISPRQYNSSGSELEKEILVKEVTMKRFYLIVTVAVLFAANLHAGMPPPAELMGKWEGAWETAKVGQNTRWVHTEFSLEVLSVDGNELKGTYCWAPNHNNPSGKARCSPAEGKLVSATVVKFRYEKNKAATITWDLKKMVATWDGPTSGMGLQSQIKKVK